MSHDLAAKRRTQLTLTPFPGASQNRLGAQYTGPTLYPALPSTGYPPTVTAQRQEQVHGESDDGRGSLLPS